MSEILDEFEKRTAGTWLKAINVDIGETFRVEGTELDEITFAPKTYLIAHCVAEITTENRKKGEKWNARIGTEAYSTIKVILGKDWIDNKLKVQEIKTYKGLNQKGIIWTAVKIEKGERITPSPTQLTRNNVEVSDHVKLWLSDNKSIIGQPIPFPVYNDTPKNILEELNEVGLLFMKDDYPHIHPDAAETIQ